MVMVMVMGGGDKDDAGSMSLEPREDSMSAVLSAHAPAHTPRRVNPLRNDAYQRASGRRSATLMTLASNGGRR
eukprot:128879-Rhodomonas_salina.1